MHINRHIRTHVMKSQSSQAFSRLVYEFKIVFFIMRVGKNGSIIFKLLINFHDERKILETIY